MTVLEKAVSDLAGALETLESTLEDRIDSHRAARRQVKIARRHTIDASNGLSAAISDVQALLKSHDANEKG